MSTSTPQLLLYGLRIQSALPLHQDRWIAADSPPDVIVRLGSTMTSTDHPPVGRVLLDLDVGRRLYCAVQRAEGDYVLRCHGACDFVIDADLRQVTVHLVQDADPALASVLATGMLLSFLLVLRGHPVLHGSAVQVEEAALAFVGSSGMGKSTMAALLCAEGAALITDDVLRVDLGQPGPPTCHLGATELRLRKAAVHLASRFGTEISSRRTVDSRDALALPAAAATHLPLAGIVIPLPDRKRATPALERLDDKAALLTLLRFPRILGWRDPTIIDRHFHELGELVARVPVHLARMPWGPPFPPDIARSLLEGLDLKPLATVSGGQAEVSGPR